MNLSMFPDDGSASRRLFHKLYLVRAPRSLTMTKDEIEMYGQRVTGIKQLDSYLANEMITGRIPTTEMARIISDGGCIQFCNKFDVKQCYTDLHQHMVNWEYILSNNYNVSAPPKEDFEMLKELQTALEAYSGLLDRDDLLTNPIGKFSQLTAKDFRRKRAPTRVHLGGLNANSAKPVEYEHIQSWEDLESLNRSTRR